VFQTVLMLLDTPAKYHSERFEVVLCTSFGITRIGRFGVSVPIGGVFVLCWETDRKRLSGL